MEKSQMSRVRQASIAARADPLRLLVTLKPKKLKNAMLTMLPTVDTCACTVSAWLAGEEVEERNADNAAHSRHLCM